MVTGMDDETAVNGASITTAFLNHHICSGQNAVAKNFLAQGREIRPIAGLRTQSFGNNAGNHLVALPEFHSFARTKPSLQPCGVPKLANVYAGHNKIVPQLVTHCQRLGLSLRHFNYLAQGASFLGSHHPLKVISLSSVYSPCSVSYLKASEIFSSVRSCSEPLASTSLTSTAFGLTLHRSKRFEPLVLKTTSPPNALS